MNRARATNATIPSLSNFKARLGFNRNTLTIDQFGGDLAGGPFKLSGNITFPKLTEPTLDLHITADSVLVARNDAVTARANADIKIAGPFNSASVTGNVAFTNSQFLKNIDLIPIGCSVVRRHSRHRRVPIFHFPIRHCVIGNLMSRSRQRTNS